MNKFLQIIYLCFIAGSALAADAPTPPIFQMRLVLDAPSSETEQMPPIRAGKDATIKQQSLHVSKAVLLDQTALQSVFTSVDERSGESRISIAFTNQGKELFAAVTRAYKGKRLAIVIGGQLYSAPWINEEISNGKAEISGVFSEKEARDLVARIMESLVKHE